MNPLTKIWFWVLLAALIAIILAVVFFELYGRDIMWIWILYGVGIFLAIIAFILFCIDVAAYYRKLHEQSCYQECEEEIIISSPTIPPRPVVVNLREDSFSAAKLYSVPAKAVL